MLKRVFLYIIVIILGLSFAIEVRAQGPVRTPVPILYKLFDHGTDFQKLMPELGPVGAVKFFRWDQINPAYNGFNWGVIDQALDEERDLKVTLLSGEEVPKPTTIFIIPSLSSSESGSTVFTDCTPQWVYQEMDKAYPDNPRPVIGGKKVGHALKQGSLTAVIPAYDSYLWRDRYLKMITAFGQHYANDQRITAIVMGMGLDGETQIVKSWLGVDWYALLGTQAAGVEYRFGNNHIPSVTLAYAAAFPNTVTYMNMAPGGMARGKWAELVMADPVRHGMKHSGMSPDIDSYQGYGGYIGSMDMIKQYTGQTSIWLETAHSIGDNEWGLWALYEGLDVNPSLLTLHSDWFYRLKPELIRWANSHLTGDITKLPSVWTVLRDLEYEPVFWGTQGVSGKTGDWSQGLCRVSYAPRVWEKDLPVVGRSSDYGRQSRRTLFPDTPEILFAVSSEWLALHSGPYAVRLIYLDYGTDTLEVFWYDKAGREHWRIIYKADRGWTDLTLDIPNVDPSLGLAVRSAGDGDEYVHRFELIQQTGPTPTSTPTITVTTTATRVPTATITALPTPTSVTTELKLFLKLLPDGRVEISWGP